ncbi:uncharacterized protein LTR77_001739 [Saxophila tyrrhenica]|uniref:NF-kappa-B inhibitor-like protein 1 n=1 Tax=Saxophila tyrrhenica TaxID=1690608 RepID=A0AAV9PQQ2_9PEZI|nr:hypothetical protein LTR77_001739 [Saxophila tyrrhenica]
MPSLEESRRQVEQSLEGETDHDAILASLQNEIDRHNAIKDDQRENIDGRRRSRREDEWRSPRASKFRFKHGTKDPQDDRRKHRRSRREDSYDSAGERRHHKKRRKHGTPSREDPDTQDSDAAHPFPREPADPSSMDTDAFRASLFDALADDEGAAAYWESVYNQPIHVYPRPAQQNATTGKLEQMNDEEYVTYVKEKMWERKNPEVVFEREKREKERRAEEEERTRKREEFVRRKERQAWERAQRWKGREGAGDGEEDEDAWERYEYAFTGDSNRPATQPTKEAPSESEYTTAWSTYLSSWSKLLTSQPSDSDTKLANRLPWPVLPGKLVLKPNIEAFMRRAPADSAKDRLRTLKAERVRWHPDKIQQRFGGEVDEGTMKLVTGVFQVVDAMLEVERKGGGG